MTSSPLVSVIIATYNQEEIVGRAIESALAQITDFPVEIIVGEDCSQDRTREIVLGYADRYPGRVRVLCNEKNLFIHRNMISMMKASSARYIAWLDGDDYWTDTSKLQKQVTFLEQNPRFSAVVHKVRVLSLDGVVTDPCYPPVDAGEKSVEDLIDGDFVASPGIVFRNTLVPRVPEWYYTEALTDWPLWMVLIQDGPFMLTDDVMADYILHPNSTWSRKGRRYQLEMELRFYARCETLMPHQYLRLIRACEGERHARMSRACIKEGDWKQARESARLAATVPHLRDNATDKLRVLVESHAPHLLHRIRKYRDLAHD